MASRKLLFASIGVAVTTFGFGCSSSSGNCCALPEDSGDIVDTLLDSQSSTDSAHDTLDAGADSSVDAEASDADATSDGSSVDAADTEASGD
jgi:hypothetical protein